MKKFKFFLWWKEIMQVEFIKETPKCYRVKLPRSRAEHLVRKDGRHGSLHDTWEEAHQEWVKQLRQKINKLRTEVETLETDLCKVKAMRNPESQVQQ